MIRVSTYCEAAGDQKWNTTTDEIIDKRVFACPFHPTEPWQVMTDGDDDQTADNTVCKKQNERIYMDGLAGEQQGLFPHSTFDESLYGNQQ